MGRWRPPQPKSSAYITPEGYSRLQKELDSLWSLRAEVTAAVTAAAAEGDRSENAEYIYRKKQLREIDYRIRYLQKRLPDITVVNEIGDTSKILFGAWITLEKEDGEILQYRIVGPDEIGQKAGYISIDSPMARALLKKTVDDEISVKIENKVTHYCVTAIEYK